MRTVFCLSLFCHNDRLFAIVKFNHTSVFKTNILGQIREKSGTDCNLRRFSCLLRLGASFRAAVTPALRKINFRYTEYPAAATLRRRRIYFGFLLILFSDHVFSTRPDNFIFSIKFLILFSVFCAVLTAKRMRDKIILRYFKAVRGKTIARTI